MISKEVNRQSNDIVNKPRAVKREVKCRVKDVFAFRKKSVSVCKRKKNEQVNKQRQSINQNRGGEKQKNKLLTPKTKKTRSQTVSIFHKRRSSKTQQLMDRLKIDNSVKTKVFTLKPLPARPLDDLKTRKTISNNFSPRDAHMKIKFKTISNKNRGTSTPFVERMIDSNDMFLRHQPNNTQKQKVVQSFPVKKNNPTSNRSRKESNNTNTDEEFDFNKFQKFEEIDDELVDDFDYNLKTKEKEEKRMMVKNESFFRTEDDFVFSFKTKARKTAVFNTLPDNIRLDGDDYDEPSFGKKQSDYFYNSVVVDSNHFERPLNELEEQDLWYK